MEKKACCFTGHRRIPQERLAKVLSMLKAEIISLIERGVTEFFAGGALGFDTLAALTVLELREQYPQIRLTLVLPCKNQTHGWSARSTETYERIKENCDEYFYTSEELVPGCMHKRNRYLVDSSAFCICYLTKPTGGTAYTVNYAEKKGLTIINVAL